MRACVYASVHACVRESKMRSYLAYNVMEMGSACPQKRAGPAQRNKELQREQVISKSGRQTAVRTSLRKRVGLGSVLRRRSKRKGEGGGRQYIYKYANYIGIERKRAPRCHLEGGASLKKRIVL